MSDDDVPSTIAEAWEALCRAVDLGSLGADEGTVEREMFIAGMSVGLQIAYHHGFATLRAELEREQRIMMQ